MEWILWSTHEMITIIERAKLKASPKKKKKKKAVNLSSPHLNHHSPLENTVEPSGRFMCSCNTVRFKSTSRKDS